MEEGRVFKASSKFDDKAYAALQEYTSKKALIPICILCSIVFVVLGVLEIKKDLVMAILYFIIAVVFPFIFLFFYKKEINKKKYKPTTLGNNVTNYAEFSEDGFCEKSYRNEEQIGVTSLKYSDLVKFVEYKNYFFIYISKVQAFVVDKNGFVVGDAQSFKAFLIEKGVKCKSRVKPFIL